MKKILIILETLGLLTITGATTISCLDTYNNFKKSQILNRENPFKIPTEIKKNINSEEIQSSIDKNIK